MTAWSLPRLPIPAQRRPLPAGTPVLPALAVLVTYGGPPGLRWHLAVALLRRCDRPLLRLTKRRPEESMAVLDLAEKASIS